MKKIVNCREGAVNVYAAILVSFAIGLGAGIIVSQNLLSWGGLSKKQLIGDVAAGLMGLESSDTGAEADTSDITGLKTENNSSTAISERIMAGAAAAPAIILSASAGAEEGSTENFKISVASSADLETGIEPPLLDVSSSASSADLLEAPYPDAGAPARKGGCDFGGGGIPSGKILINEIAWMGVPTSSDAEARGAAEREWVEIKNNSPQAVSLDGWQMRDESGKLTADFTELEIASGRFMILSRGDWNQSSALNYSGSLSNAGSWLKLFDGGCMLVDEVNAKDGWPAGNNSSKKTMERRPDGGWQTSAAPGGTPGRENSFGEATAAFFGGGGGVSASPVSSNAGNPRTVYPKLLITEIQVESPSSTHDEMIEIYNPNSDAVDLTGWYIQKKSKSVSSAYGTYAAAEILKGRSIAGKGFFVIAHPSSSFGRDAESDYGIAAGNTFAIKNPNGDIADKVGWGEASDCEGTCAPEPGKGQSISRKSNGADFEDTGQNGDDFEIRLCASPGAFFTDCPAAFSADTGLDSSSSDSSASSSAVDTETSSSSLEEQSSTMSYGSSSPDMAADSTSTGDIASSSAASSTAATSTEPASSSPEHVLIYEIKITGGPGKTNNDYVEIYNPSSTAIDLSGWKLKKRTKSGEEYSIRVFPEGSQAAARGFFTWANSADDFSVSMGAQVSSSETLADNNSIALMDSSGTIVDALAWGEGHINPFVEAGAFPQNPAAGEVLRRKDFEDSNDNSLDFTIVPE